MTAYEKIFKEMHPETPLNKLIPVDDEYYGEGLKYIFLDEEGDPVEVYFVYDGCAHLIVKDYEYLILDWWTLFNISEALEEAEGIFQKRYSK
jgi:hypothetical protein